ncbi:hypothetical protein OAD37_04860 [Gammaproteobacteria bacterium]|nr:hypothetical protein [Gammaproteobacteria bacterium]MDB9901106.1 hypothetical protein [Gammaproteobacteria bacterium]
MKNLSMLFSLLVIFAVQVDAAPSKAEAEVSKAFIFLLRLIPNTP